MQITRATESHEHVPQLIYKTQLSVEVPLEIVMHRNYVPEILRCVRRIFMLRMTQCVVQPMDYVTLLKLAMESLLRVRLTDLAIATLRADQLTDRVTRAKVVPVIHLIVRQMRSFQNRIIKYATQFRQEADTNVRAQRYVPEQPQIVRRHSHQNRTEHHVQTLQVNKPETALQERVHTI